MSKGMANKRYTAEFKKHVVETMLNESLRCPDCYNNRRIKTIIKGLPSALHRQQALSHS